MKKFLALTLSTLFLMSPMLVHAADIDDAVKQQLIEMIKDSSKKRKEGLRTAIIDKLNANIAKRNNADMKSTASWNSKQQVLQVDVEINNEEMLASLRENTKQAQVELPQVLGSSACTSISQRPDVVQFLSALNIEKMLVRIHVDEQVLEHTSDLGQCQTGS